MIIVNSWFKKIDWTILVAVIFLALFGLSAIYSVALGQGLGQFANFQKQLMWLVIGIFLMIILSKIDYHIWRKWCWVGYFGGLLLLILVLTPLGSTIRGTRGWFNLGWFSFQPVELMKVFLILCLTDVYSRHARTIHKIWQLVFVGIILLLPLGLVMIQPDFGSAMVLFFTWFISFFFVTKNKWHIVIIMGLIAAVFAVSWFFVFQPYQKDRVLTFLNPSLDPMGRGYNVRQSIIAVGAGQFMGRGLGFGSQSQLKFIPECQTDFIFSVIAEELGFIGVMFVLGFYGLVFHRLYTAARKAPDDFGMFFSLLVLILIFVHVFINIGMGVGILPVTGISLPLISYGGSFLVVIMCLIGVVLNIYRSGVMSRKF